MRRLLLVLVVLPSLARAGVFDDGRQNVVGRLGSSPVTVMARGQYTLGQATKGDLSQGGGEVSAEFAMVPFPTRLGGLIGVEGEFSLGLTRSEFYADGTLKDQRKAGEKDPTVPKFWLTTRLGARMVISPTPLVLSDRLALRLGLVGGLQLEGSGARSWTMGGAFTAGAHLAVGTPEFGLLLAWLAIPPQGDVALGVLTRHQLSLDLGVGSVAVGVRVQLDHFDTPRIAGVAASSLSSQTFSLAVGYRAPSLKL